MIKRVLGFQNPAYLSLHLEQMVITKPAADGVEEITCSVPIEDIGVVILEHPQVTITRALITKLQEQNCALISCDDHHMPIGLMLPLDGNNLQSERFQSQINASEPLRKQLWQQTVQQKIRNQAAVLETINVENRNMLHWVTQVRSGDVDNVEGRAAAYYWRNIFTDLPYFVRDRNGDGPNAWLNYGYAIIRAIIARALVATGMLPTLGIHHHNRYNAYCLADDIMEPYRPFVDEEILQLRQKFAESNRLTPEIKRALLSLPVKEVLIDGHRSPLMVAAQTTACSLQKCFEGECRKLIYPEM